MSHLSKQFSARYKCTANSRDPGPCIVYGISANDPVFSLAARGRSGRGGAASGRGGAASGRGGAASGRGGAASGRGRAASGRGRGRRKQGTAAQNSSADSTGKQKQNMQIK